MNEDYLSYWGMSKPPFSLTPDPDMLYLSAQHSECLMRLKYAIFSHKGGALLVSDNAGNGKTSALARLQNDLREYYSGRVRVVFIDHPTLSPVEMIGEISRQLGGELHTTEKIRSLNSLRDRLFALYNESIKVVVIVDEGQMLKERPDILQELRILLNFCVSDAFLLTFIFSGQKPLDGILRDMPEFWQRLPVRFFLKNLDYNDTKSLIQFRLRKVGVNDDIFTADAFEGIYHYSEGCPRIICSVADLCLLIGFSKRVRRIGFVEVSAACRDMESTGDSFHYFAYIKSQSGPKPSADPGTGGAPSESVFRKAASIRPNNPVPEEGRTCPSCSSVNVPGQSFCDKCGTPLHRKCPKCGAINDGTDGICSSCNADMDQERRSQTERLRNTFLPHDVLEGNYAVWLQASGVGLENGESVAAVFTRGNIFTSGAFLSRSAGQGRMTRKSCDFVLTDRRIVLRSEDDAPMIIRLERVETCIVSDNGKRVGKRHSLVLGLKQGIYTVEIPLRGAAGKSLCEEMAVYIQSVMLK